MTASDTTVNAEHAEEVADELLEVLHMISGNDRFARPNTNVF